MEIDDSSEDNTDTMGHVVKKNMVAKNKLAFIVKLPKGETQYCCVQCPVRSNVKEELEIHLLVHNNEYRHLCPVCGTGLKRREHMERHMFEHRQVRSHVCEVCNKAFKRKEHLNIHRTIHTGDKNEICVLCNKSFYRKDHLQKHLQTHGKHLAEQGMVLLTEQELMNIKAEAVDIPSEDSQDQESNMDSHEDYHDMQESMESVECNVSIVPEPEVTSVPTSHDRPHGCHLCEKTYKRRDHLKLHLQTHQKKDKICTECGKAFHRQDQLLAHMGTHFNTYTNYEEDDKATIQHFLVTQDSELNDYDHEESLLVPRAQQPRAAPPERRHECEVCHRKFKRKQHLKVHYNVHTKGQQPNIWCSKCFQGFFMNSDFESHQCAPQSPPAEELTDSPQPDAIKENEYPLEILPMEEPKVDESQYIHIRDESAIPSPRIVYVCKYCQKPFRRKDHYKIHLHIHTGIKSFFCPECGKGFYRKDHLQKHIQVHSKPKLKIKKDIPGLFPINMLLKKEVKPEITIHAPSNTKLRVPLQIKVPYQVVMSMDNGEQRAVTVDPQSSTSDEVIGL